MFNLKKVKLMNKEEFMKVLEQSLENMDSCEKKDILYDYEEHFRIGEEAGKGDEHMEILSKIALTVQYEENVERLRNAKTPEEIIEIIEEGEM